MKTYRISGMAALLLGLLVAAAVAGERQPTGTAQTQAIREVLQQQVKAWNRQDLEGFMAGYWNSPDLTFYSGGAVTRGWQATLERYRKRYQSGGQEMGRLDFQDLNIESLGPQAACVRGRWHLAMPSGKDLKGLFTLIVRKFPDGWKIVHDHTSAE